MTTADLIRAVWSMGIGDGLHPENEPFSIHRYASGYSVFWNRPEGMESLGMQMPTREDVISFIRGQNFMGIPIQGENL